MEITFRTKTLQKACTDARGAARTYGTRQAAKLRQRLDEMRAAPNLGLFWSEPNRPGLPGRCHELKGDMAGKLSLDLIHPDRLVFEPANDPLPTKPDGGLDWSKVTAVHIVDILDTHD